MKQKILLCFLFIVLSTVSNAQLLIAKMVGKDAKHSPIGYGAFASFQLPVTQMENRYLVLELMDLVIFPEKTDTSESRGYLSIKLGYKHIFSEGSSGFYLSPMAGYARVAYTPPRGEGIGKDGIALAMEGGYQLAVGERGNFFTFGLKFETDRAGPPTIVNSVAFRVAYSWGIYKNRNDY